jgi:hypothetical protein
VREATKAATTDATATTTAAAATTTTTTVAPDAATTRSRSSGPRAGSTTAVEPTTSTSSKRAATTAAAAAVAAAAGATTAQGEESDDGEESENEGGMSAYERARMALIAENRKMLASLGLSGSSSSMNASPRTPLFGTLALVHKATQPNDSKRKRKLNLLHLCCSPTVLFLHAWRSHDSSSPQASFVGLSHCALSFSGHRSSSSPLHRHAHK